MLVSAVSRLRAGVGVSSAGADASEEEDTVRNHLCLLRYDGDSTDDVIPVSCNVGVKNRGQGAGLGFLK